MAQAQNDLARSGGLAETFLSSWVSLRCGMAAAIRHFTDALQGATLQKQPIWLLGTYYGVRNQDAGTDVLLPEAVETFMQDFKSRIWVTYRTGFPAIGADGITSDVGWGCTLRSGQMLLAEALLRHTKGRNWSCTDEAQQDPSVIQLLSMFADHEDAPLSLHQLCKAGDGLGVVPGKWLGPWVLCKALQQMVEATQPQGLKVHVVCDPGGGAPALDVAQVQSVFSSPPAASQQAVSSSHTMATHAAVEAGVSGDGAPSGTGAAGAPSAPGAHGPQGMTAAQDRQEAPAHDCVGSGMDAAGIGQREACEQAGSNGFHGEAGQAVSADDPPPHTGLLLLLPLTLGVGKANPLYYPQLLEVLQYPQTVGIVGGRPSSSLYFVGHQDANLIYLDPHEPQPAAPLPAAAPTYFCPTVRLMPIASMDPSLAIGFYCASAQDFEDLAQRLGALAQQHRSAPMVTLAGVGPAATKQPQEQASSGQLVISDDLDEADGEGSGSIVSQSSQETHGVVAASPDASPMRSSANGTGNKHKGARRTSRHEDWEFV